MVYEDGLRSLAELTSASVELFRKMAELVLLPQVIFLTHTKEHILVFQEVSNRGCKEVLQPFKKKKKYYVWMGGWIQGNGVFTVCADIKMKFFIFFKKGCETSQPQF